MIRDLTDQRFGRLTAIRVLYVAKHTAYWLCLCDCGTEATVSRGNLHQGTVQSCGCLARGTRFTATHGRSRTAEYRAYQRMFERTANPRHHSFANYGARGITVCDRWRGPEGYLKFRSDMGQRPAGCSIDRIDPDGNYEPPNCRWATPAEQARNKRTNRLVTYQGETLCMADWAMRLGINRTTIDQRLRYGWSVARAFTTPIRQR